MRIVIEELGQTLLALMLGVVMIGVLMKALGAATAF